MTRGILAGIIAGLLIVGGYVAYRADQKDKDTFSIEVGPEGVKVDPAGE